MLLRFSEGEKEMSIHDDFLNKTYHKEILELMSVSDQTIFPWFFSDNITGEPDDKSDTVDNLENYGFFHIFWGYPDGPRESMYTDFIRPLLYKIMDEVGATEILRSRGDMTMYSPSGFKHNYHIDFDFKNIGTVYYVNDSDGETECVSGASCTPKANRLVIFDGQKLHTGHSPKKHKTRILINSNFK